ncbi:relaxase/mobilization nuclease-like protein [Anseongella ginsenosidimutans]|uniref:Relaxase/mobilization nuclease-like protein n=1 Tax=Anseongella ginsenosidimutans TaxID=496056 RepID=A0A4R3KKB8_9SPHI|nr:relaxase/mobilization nuclease domain-containing protein [Anseongella ginsenosidimutans]QEC53621.1 relaxase [Anseongella ginsenosidimutans]TCS83922.1 relaxase/mobilization nuclease-like protein [Anseongella ginsenosidimutans]
MVTKIISGKNIRGLLLYNEHKVSEGQASLIMASRFGTDLDNLDLKAKLTRFEHLTEANSRVKTNALHILLNFDRTDKLTTAAFQQIATRYMQRIGFGEQPYLVYQHHDANHPHIHIVTTNIKPDGKRIDIHGIGRTLSETARKELENEFNLTKAEGRNKSQELDINPIPLEKAHYGKTPTKRAIYNVVSHVLKTYKFTSLAEYNAALKQFNLTADRGKEDTIMFQKRGLVYSIINEEGKRIGIPFKASALAGRPTLDKIEKTFARNKEKRLPHRESLKRRIDQVLGNYHDLTKATFAQELKQQQVAILFRQNAEGLIYGVTFVDHLHKTVFNGSDLGKAYSAKALTAGLSSTDRLKAPKKEPLIPPALPASRFLPSLQVQGEKEALPEVTIELPAPTSVLETLLKQETEYSNFYHPRKKKKRKKRQEPQVDQGLS